MKGSELVIENVVKNFGAFKALKGVSFEIKSGEFFSLLGPSGCGKTTLLRIIGGFEDSDAGKIMLDGSDIPTRQFSALQDLVGLDHQDLRRVALEAFLEAISVKFLLGVEQDDVSTCLLGSCHT